MHLAVYPPDGRVRVAVPHRIKNDAVRLAVVTRLSWIHRHKRKYADQERESLREYVSRESHFFEGRRYLLNVIEQNGPPKVVLNTRPVIDLCIRKGTSRARREKVLQEWYRREMKVLIPAMVEKWEKIVGVEVHSWGVKRMKTKWGSCNVRARRIWLNLELIKKPLECLEYVIVHEMVHLRERRHNERFTALMDEFLPQWRLRRDELNRAPLGHTGWKY